MIENIEQNEINITLVLVGILVALREEGYDVVKYCLEVIPCVLPRSAISSAEESRSYVFS